MPSKDRKACICLKRAGVVIFIWQMVKSRVHIAIALCMSFSICRTAWNFRHHMVVAHFRQRGCKEMSVLQFPLAGCPLLISRFFLFLLLLGVGGVFFIAISTFYSLSTLPSYTTTHCLSTCIQQLQLQLFTFPSCNYHQRIVHQQQESTATTLLEQHNSPNPFISTPWAEEATLKWWYDADLWTPEVRLL